MKVVHVSAVGVQDGGAARATYRLHTGLRKLGLDSRVLVDHKSISDPTVDGTAGLPGRIKQSVRRRLNEIPLYRYRDRDSEPFSLAWLPERQLEEIQA